VVSRDHEVCLAAEHAERRRSPSTTEFGVPLPKVQNPSNGRIQNTIFLTTAAWLGKSVLNLICPTTPCSLVNWFSSIPPAPTIHYAKKHLEVIWEGYSWNIADYIVAGAAVQLSLSASFVVQARWLEISAETAGMS
jgi:hypothetical protein